MEQSSSVQPSPPPRLQYQQENKVSKPTGLLGKNYFKHRHKQETWAGQQCRGKRGLSDSDDEWLVCIIQYKET